MQPCSIYTRPENRKVLSISKRSGIGRLPAELGLVGVVDWGVVLEHGEQVLGRWGGDDDVPRGGGDEAFQDGRVDEGEQRVVVAVDVEEADGLGVDAELGPGDDLEELLEGAVAAGERDEGVGVARHLGLALVHPGHVLELPRRVADELPRQHRLGRDPQHAAAGVVDGAGDEAHQADAAAAVHKVAAELDGGEVVGLLLPGAAAAEHAHPAEPRCTTVRRRRRHGSIG